MCSAPALWIVGHTARGAAARQAIRIEARVAAQHLARARPQVLIRTAGTRLESVHRALLGGFRKMNGTFARAVRNREHGHYLQNASSEFFDGLHIPKLSHIRAATQRAANLPRRPARLTVVPRSTTLGP